MKRLIPVCFAVLIIITTWLGCTVKDQVINLEPTFSSIDWSEVVILATGQLRGWPINALGTIAFTISDDDSLLFRMLRLM